MKALLTILVLLFLATAATADDRAETLDKLMTRYYKLGQFNGAVLIAENEDVLLRRGYGFADQQNELANAPADRFFLGSISKSFTANLILQLVDEERLDLDKTIADYLPHYRRDTGTQITLLHLLTHKDGLRNYTNNPDYWHPYEGGAPMSTADYIGTYCSSDLEFVPGAEYRYGNSGYSILGAIIEEVTGEPFSDVLQTRILDPLGMQSAGDVMAGVPTADMAKGYAVGPNGYRLAEPVYKPLLAAASMYAAVDDLLRYARSTDPEVLLPRILHGTLPGTFSYGWTVSDYTSEGASNSVRVLSANGEVNGYNALLLRTVETQQTIILLSNTGETELLAMAANALRVLNGHSPQRPMPRTRDGFYRSLQEQGVDAAIRHYRDHRDDDPTDYIYFRWPLRILATQLTNDGRVEDAIKFLELNLETHPDDMRTTQMLKDARGSDST